MTRKINMDSVKFNAPAIVESYNGVAYGGADLGSLMGILETARPHDSKAEKRFATQWLDPIEGMKLDSFGNRILVIPGVGESIVWASHIDTVHRAGGKQKIRKAKDVIKLAGNSKSSCLGADDGAGIWLMLEMIEAGKPGTYIFHRGEEVGGIGSDFIATHSAELTASVQAVISLDRYGFDSVITHQGGQTCSTDFALSLAAGLQLENLKPDSGGLFTDSANYVDVVGECTNLSVGYFGHHTVLESLDVSFICLLRSKLIALDPNTLVFERKAGDPQWDTESQNDNGFYPANHDSWGSITEPHVHDMTTGGFLNDSDYYQTGDSEHRKMTRLLADHPEIVADLLRDYGITLDELADEVCRKTGDLSYL